MELLEQGWSRLGETAISVQVLQEFHVNLCKHGLSTGEASAIVQRYAVWPVVDNTLRLLQAALKEQSRWKISFWDALILAAARAAGAAELVTEDLNHGQNFDGIKAINPFL